MDTYLASAKFLPATLSTDARETPADRQCSVEAEISLDDALVLRLQRGDREAFTELFRKYAGSIRSLGAKILRDEAEADDLVQEVFLYLYRKRHLFDRSKGPARSWIFQVAYTQAFLRRRLLKSKGVYALGIIARPREMDIQTKVSADYDDSVEGRFGRNGWRRTLESLTELQRETLRLHFFEGYTFAEIAERLGQSYANVRNHHYRGLEKLRKHLAEHSCDSPRRSFAQAMPLLEK